VVGGHGWEGWVGVGVGRTRLCPAGCGEARLQSAMRCRGGAGAAKGASRVTQVGCVGRHVAAVSVQRSAVNAPGTLVAVVPGVTTT
jgi:hypothetical protein